MSITSKSNIGFAAFMICVLGIKLQTTTFCFKEQDMFFHNTEMMTISFRHGRLHKLTKNESFFLTTGRCGRFLSRMETSLYFGLRTERRQHTL